MLGINYTDANTPKKNEVCKRVRAEVIGNRIMFRRSLQGRPIAAPPQMFLHASARPEPFEFAV